MRAIARVTLGGIALALAFFPVGCGSRQPTAADCAASAVRGVAAHGALTRLPETCRPLGPAALSQAIRIAVGQLSGAGDKAERRHRAGRARASMSVLTTAAQRASARRAMAIRRRTAMRCNRPGRCAARPPTRSSGIKVPIGIAALLAWLLTVATGGFLLAKWLASRARRGDAGSAARPPALVVSHLGLAIGGMAAWIGYLLTTWPALAWTGMCLLLPAAGMGMATLVQAIPDPDRSSRPACPGGTAKRGAPVVLIAVHGALATATLLLALLGSVEALGSR